MKITYDTETDSLSSPDLTPEQVQHLTRELLAAMSRNDGLQTVASEILSRAREYTQR